MSKSTRLLPFELGLTRVGPEWGQSVTAEEIDTTSRNMCGVTRCEVSMRVSRAWAKNMASTPKPRPSQFVFAMCCA